MHASKALRRHQSILHAASLVLRHRLGAHQHHKQQNSQTVAVHLAGVVLPKDDLWCDKAG